MLSQSQRSNHKNAHCMRLHHVCHIPVHKCCVSSFGMHMQISKNLYLPVHYNQWWTSRVVGSTCITNHTHFSRRKEAIIVSLKARQYCVIVPHACQISRPSAHKESKAKKRSWLIYRDQWWVSQVIRTIARPTYTSLLEVKWLLSLSSTKSLPKSE